MQNHVLYFNTNKSEPAQAHQCSDSRHSKQINIHLGVGGHYDLIGNELCTLSVRFDPRSLHLMAIFWIISSMLPNTKHYSGSSGGIRTGTDIPSMSLWIMKLISHRNSYDLVVNVKIFKRKFLLSLYPRMQCIPIMFLWPDSFSPMRSSCDNNFSLLKIGICGFQHIRISPVCNASDQSRGTNASASQLSKAD